MSEVDLYHRLYTHAGDGGGKFQNAGDADAASVLGASQLTRLDKLMASIRPPADGRAWAAARLGPFACLVVSESALDGRGRSGARTHARVARVAPKTATLDLPALVEFEGDENDTALSVAAWSTVGAEQYSREELAGVVAAFLASIPREETITAPAADLRLLATAWSLLPLSFQETITWSLDAAGGARVSVAFTAGASSPIPRSVNALARRWVDWVLDRPDDAKRLIETTRATSLRDFEEELDEVPMPTQPKPRTQSQLPSPSPSRGGLDPQLAEFLNKQIRASEDSIYEWLEEELRQAGRNVTTPHARGGARPMPANATLAAGIAGGILLIALGTLGFLFWKAQQRIARLERQVVALSDAAGVPEPVATAAEEPVDEEPAASDPLNTPEAIAGAGWPERFQWVVENRQRDVVPMIVALARNATIATAKARELQRMADLLERDQKLTSADRRSLRAYLFELVAAPNSRIDGDPDDVPRTAIATVKNQLQVGTASNDPGDAALQSEVVLRWLARQR